MAAAAAEIGAGGQSSSWLAQKRNVQRVFDLFRGDVPGGYPPWDEIDEATLCSTKIYQQFAHFLTHKYKIESGRNDTQHYAMDTITGMLGIAIRLAYAKFAPATASVATKTFFTCLDAGTSESSKWLKGVKTGIKRACFQRAMRDGTPMDQSASPVYRSHIEAMNRALSLEGSPEAAQRKLVLMSVYYIAGRAGEMTWVTLDALEYDPYFEMLFAEVPQEKTSKLKYAAFPAGVNRHCCFFLALGDDLALTRRNPFVQGETMWLLTEVPRGGSSAGTKMTAIMKALLPRGRGGAAKYQNVAVASLRDDICAAGLRTGASNSLCSRMPADFVVHATGHDMKGASALYEYINPDRALLMPTAIILGGYAPLPWGQLGKAQVGASLGVLTIDDGLRRRMVDDVLGIDSASPSTFKASGALRPALEQAVATMIMYYDEREKAHEMSSVLTRMRTVYVDVFLDGRNGRAPRDAHDVLVAWGCKIRTKFDLDNLHLTSRALAGDQERLVHAIMLLGKQVENLGRRVEEDHNTTLEVRTQLSAAQCALTQSRRRCERSSSRCRAPCAALAQSRCPRTAAAIRRRARPTRPRIWAAPWA